MKRRAFDSERWKSLCSGCTRIASAACNLSSNSASAKLKTRNCTTNLSRYNNVLRALSGMRDRLKEEAMVIENCFKVNAATRKECPLFNPSDYHQYQGYPHHTQLFSNSKKPLNLWYLQGLRAKAASDNLRFRKESPLFNPSDYLQQGYPHYTTPAFQKPGIR